MYTLPAVMHAPATLSPAEPAFALDERGRALLARAGQIAVLSWQLDSTPQEWADEAAQMLARARRWAAERADRVADCVFVLQHGNPILFVSPQAIGHKFHLADELVDMRMEVVGSYDDYDFGYIEVLTARPGRHEHLRLYEEAILIHANP